MGGKSKRSSKKIQGKSWFALQVLGTALEPAHGKGSCGLASAGKRLLRNHPGQQGGTSSMSQTQHPRKIQPFNPRDLFQRNEDRCSNENWHADVPWEASHTIQKEDDPNTSQKTNR